MSELRAELDRIVVGMAPLEREAFQGRGKQGGFIDLDTAARRANRNPRHLARLCRDKWQSANLAELRTPPDGGKATWHIREDADASFASVKFPEQIGVDLRKYPPAKRDEALRRRAILQEWEQHVAAAFRMGGFTKKQATGHFLERLLLERNLKVARQTLYNWHNAYRAGGVEALVDGRGLCDDEAAEKDDPFIAEVKRLWLNRNKPTLTLCREMAAYTARERGWAVRNYKACQRMKEAIPAAVVYKLRHGEAGYVNNAEPYLEGDYTSLASNELWCSDHHQFDVLVSVNERLDGETGEIRKVLKRPWVTAFQDMRSRKIVGWLVYAHDPNSDVIFSVFRQAVIDHGVPTALLIDNGKDYDCYDLNGRTKKDRWAKRRVNVQLDPPDAPGRTAGLFAELGIKVSHALPYHGQSKPIERWFGFVETRTTCWSTYCGNSTANKPQDLHVAKPKDLQLELERGNAPTLSDFATWFDQWVISYNAGHEHSGQGMDGRTPDQVHAASWNGTSKRTAPRQLLDLMCLKQVRVKVGQNGVTWKGLRYGQYEPALQRMLGLEVLLRVDERNIGHVLVHSADDRQFICIAPANQAVPKNASAQDLRIATAKKTRGRKLLKEYILQRPRMADDLPDLMLRAAADRAREAQASQGSTPPDGEGGPNIQPIRHALEDQLPAIQRASERASNRSALRPAVGSESVPIPSMPERFTYTPEQSVEDEADLPSFREFLHTDEDQ